jgi:hypothetical protein
LLGGIGGYLRLWSCGASKVTVVVDVLPEASVAVMVTV